MNSYLKFWGTRGSCSVSGAEYVRFGGNTCTLEMRYEGMALIFDAGTGIRALGEELLDQKIKHIHLFLSHAHWDHLIGLPFFSPIYQPEVHITVWSPPNIGRSYKELISDLLAPEFFPVRLEQVKANLSFKTLHQNTPLTLGNVTLNVHHTNHPGLTYCFKVQTPEKTFSYITDNEMLQGYHGPFNQVPTNIAESCQSMIQFLKNCDLIIHEAQYTEEEYRHKVGWGHSSVLNAAYLIEQTKTPIWFVTHHDPSHTDADLVALEIEIQHLFHQHHIPCRAQWISDGFLWPID